MENEIPGSRVINLDVIDELTFDLTLTLTLYIPYKKVRVRSKVSSSKFYDPDAIGSDQMNDLVFRVSGKN